MLFNEELLENIHNEAVRILEEVGIKCESPSIRQIFEDTGMAAYDETTKHLHVLSPLIEQTLNTAPKRDQFFIPENSFGVGGTAPFVFDDTTGDLIPPSFEHVKKIATIVNQADVVKFMARGVLVPKQEVKVIETIIEHCDKPIYVAALTDEGIAKAKEVHDTRGNLTVQFSIINSPLNIIESMIEPFFSCVRQGIPTYVSTMPMAGLSAPYSMSSLLSLTHAEGLFGIALAQLINPGVTVVHAGLPSIANIQKKYAVDLGLMSHNIANLIMEKLNKRLDIPSIQTACTTSQDQPNEISEEDVRRGYALLKHHGFHQMRHAFGFLKELVSFSIAKLERHIELCEETPASDFDLEPVVFDLDGFETIRRNSSKPNYMSDPHTLKHTGKEFLD